MNKPTLYFYDLETSGISPRDDRVMQFAGQRTDLELHEIAKPHNYLIRMSEDVLPKPDAVLITGITPQKTIADGISESDFLSIFHEQIATPGTIFVGFNSVRFDDEFMRYMHYRNFYDPYEWQYIDDKSRWDLLDLARMTRALRPEGIKWPVNAKGKATNSLDKLASLNNLEHDNAHDALSDARASIALARLIKAKQPKLFDFLLSIRASEKALKIVQGGQPFIYTSGKYSEEWQKTTAAGVLAEHPRRKAVLVFDLRQNPSDFFKLSPSELADIWRWMKEPDKPRLPVKTLQFNRCPAIAPLSVLDKQSQDRLNLAPNKIAKNFEILQSNPEFRTRVLEALEILDTNQQTRFLEEESEDVDTKLYDGFFDRQDKTKMSLVRASSPDELANLSIVFKDGRLQAMLPLYKARNFHKSLDDSERAVWETFRQRKLLGGKQASRMAKFFARLDELSERSDLSAKDQYLLEELQLYGQSIMPL